MVRQTHAVIGLLLGLCSIGPAQVVSIGLKAGVPLMDPLDSTSTGATIAVLPETQRWLAGPTLELHLPFRLSFEVDALYRREKYTAVATRGFNVPDQTYTGSNWQIPFLAKYELSGGLLRPFIDGGVSYRHRSGTPDLVNANSAGVTLGGGISLKFLFLRVTPEIRYTHWRSGQSFQGVPAPWNPAQPCADWMPVNPPGDEPGRSPGWIYVLNPSYLNVLTGRLPDRSARRSRSMNIANDKLSPKTDPTNRGTPLGAVWHNRPLSPETKRVPST